MNRNLFLTTLMVFILSISSYAQTKEPVKARAFWKSSSMRVVAPHSSKSELIPSKDNNKEAKDGRYRASKINPIIGKGSSEDDILAKNKSKLEQKIIGKTPELVFDSAFSNTSPSDPSLAVGPNHVVAVFNTGYRFFDKTGTPLSGQLSPDNIFSPNSCCDLTISYDNAADRWIMSILYSSDGHVEVAVSQGPDPVNDSWSVYSFPNIADYQKISIWSDGYYMTANVNSSSAATSNAIFVMDRTAMLAGEQTAQIIALPLPGISTPPSPSGGATGGFYSPQAFNISNSNLPALGNAPIVYLQDDAFSGITQDHLKIWNVNVDFNTPGNSTISQPTELNTTAFISVFDGGSFSNLPQPNGGSLIDAIQGTVMNQAQFRKFDTHNSAVFTFTVDTEASALKIAGIRWYELRQSGDGQPWTIFQEGTYTSPDGKHAWNGSMMMDDAGNLALGYSGMGGSTNTFVSSFYTGRFDSDTAGTMSIAETLIAAGTGNIPGNRYADYSKLDIDPNNDRKFWHVNEYMNNTRANVVGVFQIAPDKLNDLGVVNIDLPPSALYSATENITVSIFNYGTDPASNFDVTYQIDGGTVVTETFTGTIAGAASADFTFAQTADLSVEGQTYSIVSSTALSGDETTANDSKTLSVTSLFRNDIGVTAITSPENNSSTGALPVTVTIENFGGEAKSSFNVSYTVNGNTAIEETVPGPLDALSTMSYTFSGSTDFSAQGTYEITATTSLANDVDSSNDSTTANVDIIPCETLTNTTTQDISTAAGATVSSIISVTNDITVENIFVTVNINHTYTDDLTLTLTSPDGTIVELSSRNGGSGDNYTNTIFDDGASATILSGSAPFTGSFKPEGNLSDFYGLSSIGDWTLTITDSIAQDGGTLIDWSLSLCDTVRLGIGEKFDEANELLILDKGNNQFDVSLISSEITERLTLEVYNMLGQKLLNHTLDNNNGRYDYKLDMSYAPKGVYIIAITNGPRAATGRLIRR